LVKGTDRLALSSHTVGLSAERKTARDVIEEALRAAGLMPPGLSALAAAAQVSVAEAESLVRVLLRERRAARVGTLIFHADVLEKLRSEVAALKHASGGEAAEVDVATFKGRYGLSRKFAIPLLEWLDRERVTRRVGERRVVL